MRRTYKERIAEAERKINIGLGVFGRTTYRVEVEWSGDPQLPRAFKVMSHNNTAEVLSPRLKQKDMAHWLEGFFEGLALGLKGKEVK